MLQEIFKVFTITINARITPPDYEWADTVENTWVFFSISAAAQRILVTRSILELTGASYITYFNALHTLKKAKNYWHLISRYRRDEATYALRLIHRGPNTVIKC